MNRSSARRSLLLGTALLAIGARPAWSRPDHLRIVCVGPPASTPDVIARAYADALASHLPAGVVVVNRPGGAGFIAVAALRQSAADGGTLLLGGANLVTSFPHVYAKLPYDPQRDLVPVAVAAVSAFAIVIGPRVPVAIESLNAFVQWARSNPREVNCGTPGGVGASPHLIAAELFRTARIEAEFVPYASGPALIGDLLGSRITVGVLPEGLIRPLHDSGRLRAVATTGPVPSSILQRVPTLAAAGLGAAPGIDWFGFFAPAGTAPTIVSDLARMISDASRSAAQSGSFDAQALSVSLATPSEMVARIASEHRAWKPLVTALGLRLQ